MTIILVLMPIALLLALIFVIGFIWAVRSGQYEDLKTPQWRILLDDDPGRPDNSQP